MNKKQLIKVIKIFTTTLLISLIIYNINNEEDLVDKSVRVVEEYRVEANLDNPRKPTTAKNINDDGTIKKSNQPFKKSNVNENIIYLNESDKYLEDDKVNEANSKARDNIYRENKVEDKLRANKKPNNGSNNSTTSNSKVAIESQVKTTPKPTEKAKVEPKPIEQHNTTPKPVSEPIKQPAPKPLPKQEEQPKPIVKEEPKPIVNDNPQPSSQLLQIASLEEQEVVRLVNIEREKAGLHPLQQSPAISKVAREKSKDMLVNNYFSHTSPKYGSPFDMMKSYGVSFNHAGENIAKGQISARFVVDAWMKSPGHKKNILNPNFNKIGVGFWVLELGKTQNSWTQMFTD